MAQDKDSRPNRFSKNLEHYTRRVANQILQRTICCQPLIADVVQLNFYSTEADYRAQPMCYDAGPIRSEKQACGCIMHICEECLRDTPEEALRGWLEQELLACRQQHRLDLFYCNFRKMLWPIFPVYGSAENFIRELAFHVECALHRYIATRRILALGHGTEQVYGHILQMDERQSLRERYELAALHPWTRAQILAKMLKELMPITFLVEQSLTYAVALENQWWDHHDYLMVYDQRFLKEIAAIPLQSNDCPFCEALSEIFKSFTTHLLNPPIEERPTTRLQ